MPGGFKDHFSHDAAGYAAHRPSYPAALLEFLAGMTGRHELAWDAGCGSGQLSALLARHFARVAATDASAEQIAQAAASSAVRYRVAPAEQSGISDGSVDLAVAAQAAHWFDLDRYYAEVRRVLRPDGAVALVSYGRVRLGSELDAALRPFYEGVLGPFWPPDRAKVEDGYRSLPFPFQEQAAPPLQIETSWRLPDLLGYIDTWSSVRALRKARGDQPIDDARRALAAAWGEPGAARAVRWPLALRAGRP